MLPSTLVPLDGSDLVTRTLPYLQALAAEEQQQWELETLAEHLPDVVARFDRELRYIYVNAAATIASGLRRAEYLGRTNAELGLPLYLVRLWAERSNAAFMTGEEQRLAFAYDGPAGTRHYEARIVPERGANGEIKTLLAVTIDVSERIRVEEERIAFLDALVHDVKNPLSVIKAQTQLTQRRLQRGVVASTRLAVSLERIEAAVDEAVALIDEFLDVARLRVAQPLELRVAPLDLVRLATAVVAVLKEGDTQHVLHIDVDSPALTGKWDGMRLQRVLENLCGNAVKYSPVGGEVVVRIRSEEDERGRWAVLAVTDHGIGIPSSDIPHLFERFHRGSNVAGIRGTGIGLSGSRQIVEQYGGTIAVESSEGVGSTFTVRLPLSASGYDEPKDVTGIRSVASLSPLVLGSGLPV